MTFTAKQIEHLRYYYGCDFDRAMRMYGDKAIAVDRPKAGQRWVDTYGEVIEWEFDLVCGPPRLILPPVRKVTVTDVIFRATGETRAPKRGEWYGEESGSIYVACCNFVPGEEYPIYTRHEETREIEVDE